jgi:type II secretory pathway pseudopilin PulG
MRLANGERGDTIIEVMLAFTIFAMLAVGAISIMNKGVASAQESLETTLVRHEIDGQAEALRFLHQAYMIDPTSASGSKFQEIRTQKLIDANPTTFGDGACLTGIPVAANKGFMINPKTATVIDSLKPMNDANAPAYAQIVYNPDGSLYSPYGLWIEAIEGKAKPGQSPFIDFHIRACWYSVTSDLPHTLGTIVRLYVPA